MAENIQSYDKKEYLVSWKALFANIFWYDPSFVNWLSFSQYRKCGRAWLAGENKNSYRRFLVIEITLRDHIHSTRL